MKKNFYLSALAGCFLFLIASTNVAGATSITYTATDLPDTIPGQDLWQCAFMVSDNTFNMDYGFSIFFDYTLYSGLEDPAPFVNADWDPMVFQPDLGLPDDGIYDALALTNAASLADPFSLNFVWLGAGAPGSQPFEIYDPQFDVIETGQTAAVPLPSALLLFGSGLFGLIGFKKKVSQIAPVKAFRSRM